MSGKYVSTFQALLDHEALRSQAAGALESYGDVLNGYDWTPHVEEFSMRKQLDRIEAYLRELVETERRRELYAELERLTRGCRRTP